MNKQIDIEAIVVNTKKMVKFSITKTFEKAYLGVYLYFLFIV